MQLDDSLTGLSWLHNLRIGALTQLAPYKTDEKVSCSISDKEQVVSLSVGHARETVATYTKPPYSYANLIFFAISDSPNHKMTLTEIYKWIEKEYPFFKTAGNGWKNSVRHNLSLNKTFLKIPRTKSDPSGKGAFWGIRGKSETKNSIPAWSESVLIKEKPVSVEHYSPVPTSAFLSYHKSPLHLTTEFHPLSGENDSEASISNQSHELQNEFTQCYHGSDTEVDLSASLRSVYQNVFENELLSESLNQWLNQMPTVPDNNNLFEALSNNPPATSATPPFLDSSTGKQSTLACDNSLNLSASQQLLLNMQQLKENLRLASSIDWSNIDLSTFSDFVESVKMANEQDWQLQPAEILNISNGLNQLFHHAGITVIAETNENRHINQQSDVPYANMLNPTVPNVSFPSTMLPYQASNYQSERAWAYNIPENSAPSLPIVRPRVLINNVHKPREQNSSQLHFQSPPPENSGVKGPNSLLEARSASYHGSNSPIGASSSARYLPPHPSPSSAYPFPATTVPIVRPFAIPARATAPSCNQTFTFQEDTNEEFNWDSII